MAENMGLDKFIGNFRGGARANRFKVELNYPVAGPNIEDYIVVAAAQLPASIMGVAHAQFMGRFIPIPGDRTFDDWTITVLNDTTFSHRNAFERWSEAILANQQNFQGTANYRSMTAPLNVHQLDRQGNRIKSFTLWHAWPTVISAIDLAYDQNDAIETYSVTFAYAHWSSDTSPGESFGPGF